MTKLPQTSPSRTINAISYVLVAAMIAAVLWLHLLPAAIAGFLVYALARSIERRLRARRTLSKSAKSIAVLGVFLIAALILLAIGLGIGRLVEHGHGVDGMLLRIADVLDNLRASLPASIADATSRSSCSPVSIRTRVPGLTATSSMAPQPSLSQRLQSTIATSG